MKYVFAILVMALCSCQEAPKVVPLPHMQSILLDMHLAQERASTTVAGKTEINDDSLRAFSSAVLRHHHVSLLQFRYSLRQYQANALLMDSIYDGMIDTVMKMKIKATAIKE